MINLSGGIETPLKRLKVPGELFLLLGLSINSLAVSLMIKSSLGLSTLSSFPYVLSQVSSLMSVGAWNSTIQVLTIVAVMLITRQLKASYLLSFVWANVFGLLMNFYSGLIAGLPLTLPLRGLYYLTGFLLMGIGSGFELLCGLPILPFDTVVRDLSDHFKKDVFVTKTSLDIIFVSTSLLLSGIFLHRVVGVGIGTVLSAIFMGKWVSTVKKALLSRVEIEPVIPHLLRSFWNKSR